MSIPATWPRMVLSYRIASSDISCNRSIGSKYIDSPSLNHILRDPLGDSTLCNKPCASHHTHIDQRCYRPFRLTHLKTQQGHFTPL